MASTLGYNRTVGYLMTAAGGEAGVTLTDHEWRALVYVASNHDYSAPHLRLEEGEEVLDVEAAHAEGLRSALGKALEARDIERMRTPDGELYYDTIQRVRHVLLCLRVCVWPALPRERPADRLIGRTPRAYSPNDVEGIFSEVRLYGILRSSQRSETSRGREFPCSPPREELAHGQQQARKRQYDEHDLVDVIFSGRQSAYEVRRPEQRVIP
jgi:hypothetical protein